MDNVSFGWASRIGTIGAIAAVLVPFIPELADQAASIGVPGSVWVWVAGLLASVTVIGRMAQAAINTVYSGAPEPADEGIDDGMVELVGGYVYAKSPEGDTEA